MIGSSLGLQPNVLATIKKNNPDNHEKCMSEVVSKWLSKDETIVPTWNWLCHALYQVDRPTADKIAENHHVTDYNKLKGICILVLQYSHIIIKIELMFSRVMLVSQAS